MTLEAFYAALRALGLRETPKGTPKTLLCLTPEGEIQMVPRPEGKSDYERADIINNLKISRGATWYNY